MARTNQYQAELFALFLLLGLLAGCTFPPEPYRYTDADAACRAGDTNYFAAHLAELNSPLTTRRPGFFTCAVLLAAEKGKYDLVAFLQKAGANLNMIDWRSNGVLHAAMAWPPPTPEFIARMKEAGLDVNARNYVGSTPLSYASELQPLVVVEALLKAGSDPTIADSNGDTPLHLANSAEKFEMLVRSGARLDVTNQLGETPFQTAQRLRPKVAQRLTRFVSTKE